MAAQQIMQNTIQAHRMNDMILELDCQMIHWNRPTQRYRLDHELHLDGMNILTTGKDQNTSHAAASSGGCQLETCGKMIELTCSQPTWSMERCSHVLTKSRSQSHRLRVLVVSQLESNHTRQLTIDPNVFHLTTPVHSVFCITRIC